ncbi:type II secretion system F family protein [Flavobacterium salilacus subsp. salilacus]|uniref:type II secretion system F family protein n=1 Tax=Flavobacterium TaxID=237 RepID=UPI0010750F07|nr:MULTISPECIES: type II secretion system F family protein [Flavobacterium]KAF2518533.1 type II secretion system F family protein [Flavobacterium salilacus subsp. salilacus]MBE1615176.1 type II secretion system F family protein [Flavobacterium sp. SaA2.13]
MAFKLDNISANNSDKSVGNSIEKLLKTEITFFSSGFSNKKKQAFYLELSVLLKAGITIKEALGLIIESLKKEKDKQLLSGVLQQVINGKPFSEALYATKQFSEYEYFSLKIGEETGTTARVSKELGIFYERKNEQKRIIIAALTYPSIVLSTAVLVVIFMLSYVVPMFQDIFKQNNMELPYLTRVIVKLSEITKSYGLILFLSILLFFMVSRFLKDNYAYRKNIHLLMLKIPVVGRFISKIYLAQFTQAVTLLTSSKVPILNSIQMVTKMIRFVPLQEALTQVEANIMKGESLSESLKNNKLFDNRIISLVKVAEETNQTEYIFNQLNEQYNQEVMQQSKVLSTVLEPFIILFVGVLVAVLLVAMYLPMFQLSSAIG